MKKRLFSLVTALLLLAALWLPAFAVAEPTTDFYVADYAGVLSGELKKKIIDCNGALEQQCDGAQFVVLTVNYLDGMYSDEYAAEVFREWGIGDAEKNNGVLLLLAVQENKAWLMAGYGIQSRFDADSMMNDRFWKLFDDGKYDEAVERVVSDVMDWFDSSYGTDILDDYEEFIEDVNRGDNPGGTNYSAYTAYRLYRFVKAIAVIIIVILLLRALFRGGRGGRGGGGGGGGGFWPWFFIGRSVGRNSGYRHGYRPGGWNGGGHSGGFGGGHSGGFGGGHGGGFGGGSHHGGGGFGGGGGAGRR